MSTFTVSPPQSENPNPEIAATLITRNEARCIVRCLESVRPWVDRMIVLDTGSTDGTPELARQCGAEVHRLDWPEDFSAARNRALEIADADWNLIIDADEWIAAGGELLRGWCKGPPKLGRICVLSVYDDPQNPVTTSLNWITRILPHGVRFRGRVHEQAMSRLPRERIDLHVGHDGYLAAQLAGKRDRNRPLLLRDLQDHPGDPYIAYQLGKEAEGADDFAEACEWYCQAMAQIAPDEIWYYDLLGRHLFSLGQAGRLDEALALAGQRVTPELESPDLFFVLGNLLLDKAMADPAKAMDHWLPMAVSVWERCLAIGERPEIEGSVHGRGSHLVQHNLDILRAQMAQMGG